ncbi:MAG: glycosyltransferase family 2 protein [Solirubrobacteraceae bacterium]
MRWLGRSGPPATKFGARPRVTVPLAALRERLDDGSSGTQWSVDVEGVPGRALVQHAGQVVSFPLKLTGQTMLAGRARLVPRDYRDGSAAVRTTMSVTCANGRRAVLWSGILATAAACGHPDGIALECPLPADTTELLMSVEQVNARDGHAVGRAIWLDVRLIDESSPLEPPPRAIEHANRCHPPTANGAGGLATAPTISVLTPVHDPPLELLEEAIASVASQTFTNWELCLVDDGSRDPEIIDALRRHAASDHRIHLARREHAGGISTATNAALKLATGQYIALLDHDDTLEPNALELVAQKLRDDPTLDMIYTDEDIVMDGRQIWVHFKPGWSPDTLRTNGYTCHLGVYRRTAVEEIGGFRHEFDGSQDVDMILRLVERTNRIAHIPQILYHWRAHPSSTAGGDAKPYAYVSARRAINDHLQRLGESGARVDYGPPGLYRVEHPVDPSQRVAVVLAVSSERGLREAAESLWRQSEVAWKLILAVPGDKLAACVTELDAGGVGGERLVSMAMGPEADPSSSLAVAAAAAATAKADHLVLLQEPVVGLTHEWLRRLVGYSNQPHVAAAGPLVLAPDGRIKHSGVALPEGAPLFLLRGRRSSMDDYFGFGTSVYNVSALSGALATRREIFEQLGGLQQELGDLALIDYCIRATAADMNAVIVPDARVRAIGPDLTTNDLAGIRKLRKRWLATRTDDAYYNPNFRSDCGDFVPRSASLAST